ncbi:hypothetical protein SDC9_181724 [bioreactor metagenome]|uniref:Uncharacterized protein n=1 Tax=bioreactor metagenome TaxID=1076179 RepID=A0A645H5C0_9ZZZZ
MVNPYAPLLDMEISDPLVLLQTPTTDGFGSGVQEIKIPRQAKTISETNLFFTMTYPGHSEAQLEVKTYLIYMHTHKSASTNKPRAGL